MRITSAGNVGIGLTSPQLPLSIGKGGGANPATSGSTQSSGGIARIGSSGAATLDIGTLAAGAAWLQATNVTDLATNYSLLLNPNGGNVGIGTSSPGTKLEVSGTPGNGNIINVRNTGTTQYAMGGISFLNGATANNSSVTIGSAVRDADGTDSYFSIFKANSSSGFVATMADYDLSDNFWRFFTSNAERMRITSAGRVGVGTNAPTGLLEVADASNSITPLVVNSGSGADNTRGIAMDVNGQNYGRILVPSGSGGAMGFWTGSAGAASERMRITSGGDVGIGTSSPGVKLDVIGTVRSTGFSATGTTAFQPQVSVTNWAADATGGYYIFYKGRASGTTSQNGDTIGTMLWYGRDSANALVGTSSIFSIQTAAAGAGSVPTALVFANGGNVERMRIANDGTTTLNIGGVSNTHQFNYNESGGEIQLIDSTGAGPILIDNISGLARFYKVGSGAISMGTTGANYFQFITSSIERMRITSAGNVGVGMTNPRAKMSLGSNTGVKLATFDDGSNVISGLGTDLSGSSYELSVFSGDTGGNGIITFGQYNPSSTAYTERMRITSAGNVGIGTSSPASLLHVKRGSNATEVYPAGTWATRVINATDASTEHGLLVGNRWAAAASTVFEAGSIYGGGTGSWYSFYKIDGVGQSIWSNAGTERMRITSGGNVGIGTTTPNAPLAFGNGVATNGFDANKIRFYESGSSIYGLAVASGVLGYRADNHIFYTNASSPSERMRVNSSGNVGIGTTAPADRLHVREDLDGTTGILVQNRNGTGTPVAAVQFISGAFDLSDNRYAMISSSGGSNTTLRFWTGAGATPTERMRIGSNGGVAIGGTGTDATLHIQTSYGGYDRLTQIAPSAASKPALNIMASKNASSVDQWWTWGVQTDNTWKIQVGVGFGGNGITIDSSGNFTATGNVTAYSDARIKKDVETIDSALDLVSKMRGVRYTRTDTDKRGVGVIAQEMLEVLPEVVQQGVGDDDTLSVAYGNLVGVLIEAVKELTIRVAELEGK
jgi:hypothetical protein